MRVRGDVIERTDLHMWVAWRIRFQSFPTQRVKKSLLSIDTFGVTLPVCVDYMLRPYGGGTEENSCILIVDDNEQVRCLLKEWLEIVFPDFGVVEARNGEEAVVVAQAKLPRLVVMNVGLPEMDGIRAAHVIKQSVPDTKIVVLTMHEEEQYRNDAFASGVSAFVPKRLMQSDLLPTLSRLMMPHDAGFL